MSDYVKKVTENIPDKRLKREISEELMCHIEEKAEFYIKRGFSEEEAYIKADEEMGNEAVRVAVLLSDIHPRIRRKNIVSSIFVLLLLVLAFFTDKWGILLYITEACANINIIAGGALFLLILAMLKYAVKYNAVMLSFFLAVLTLTRTYHIFQVSFVGVWYELFSGNISRYFTNIVSRDIFPTTAMMIITGTFIMLVFLLSSLSVFISYKNRKNSFSKSMLKIKRFVNTSVSVLLIFVLLSIALNVPVYFCEPDYEYEYVSGVAIIHISDRAEAQDILKELENNAEFIADTEEKSYYISHHASFGKEELHITQYVGGKTVYSYTEEAYFHSSSENLHMPINYAYYESDELIQERRMSISVPVDSEKGYFLIVPQIEESDNSERYSVDESKTISLPLEKNYYITGNCYSSYYEIILKNAEGENTDESK